MFEHKKIQSLDDFFQKLGSRPGRGVYFYRIGGYSEEGGRVIHRDYQAAARAGVVLEGKIPNPDEKNLAYYQEIMGQEFRFEEAFMQASLAKWLPRMNDFQRQNVAAAMYATLSGLRRAGKNENMLKNAYIKFMCWLYYKFERIANRLGEEDAPKILCQGPVSQYALLLLSVLSRAGCDIVLLLPSGDGEYLKLDPASELSDELKLPGMAGFPEGYSLKKVREEIMREMQMERLYGQRPQIAACTNAWISGKILKDIQTPPAARGEDSRFFYNCYCRVSGVEDKLTYLNQLYQFQLELKNSGRNPVIVNGSVPPPSMEEISGVRRKNYADLPQMLLDLSQNISCPANAELQRLMAQAFLDVMRAEAKASGENLNQLMNKAVYLLCWLKRYQGALLGGWKAPDVGCFIHMGGCADGKEALFLKFLARLPADVLILAPDLGRKCCLKDDLLYEIHYEQTLAVQEFPREDAGVHMGTAAYHAERELDSLMYQDSGVYRERQYEKANAVVLRTMYEEIKLLWDEEVKYRPNFSVVEGTVNIPVIFAKVSGVKDGQVSAYWQSIRELVTEDAYVVKNPPLIDAFAENPMKAHAAEFLRNGKIQKSKIKSHPKYPYGYLREESQDYILEKLQTLINRKAIRGMFENGAEYTAVSVILNLPVELVRMIQKFDFTKKNPKLLYIHTGETVISLEDSIVTVFLNLIGFDIVFFIPTGYETIERHFNGKIMEEHQIGEYVYDLRAPNLEGFSAKTRTKWMDKIFKRGR